MIELHAEAPKIIVPLFARTLPELTAQAAAAQRADAADLVELRLDPLPRQDWPTALAQVRAAITKPLIVTIRTAREGGEVDLTPHRVRRSLPGTFGAGQCRRTGH